METRIVVDGPELEEVRALFTEYAQRVGTDICFQGFPEELASLPGPYRAPSGTLLSCQVEGRVAGCVAVRPFEGRTCEMKRLYVRTAFQGLGCGLFLAGQAIAWARVAGYDRMLLDTLPSMSSAQRLYERLGFREVAPYGVNPVPGIRYMELTLADDVKGARA